MPTPHFLKDQSRQRAYGSALMEDVSLCQPDSLKSCGACCGLYNYRASGSDDLVRRLKQRTQRFRAIPHTPEALQGFSKWMQDVEPQGKLLQTIYNCEFLGFLDEGCRRVGCLLHPEQNQGQDLRGASFYGAELCAAHRCQSYQKLALEEKLAMIYAIEDWFLYGLCITDIDLVKGFFFHVSRLLGERPRPGVLAHEVVRESVASFFILKVQWPFRSQEEGRFGKYCLNEDEYHEVRIPYDQLGTSRSPYDAMLVSLASIFTSCKELKDAEDLIRSGIHQCVEAYIRYSS